MKSVYLLLAALALSAALAGCAAPASAPPSSASSASAAPASVSSAAPSSPASPSSVPGQPQKTSLYEDKAIGLAVQFPEDWAGKYAVVPYPVRDGQYDGTRLEFVFEWDYAAPLVTITYYPKAWGEAQPSQTTDAAVALGSNSLYAFVATAATENPYLEADPEQSAHFAAMMQAPEDLSKLVSITEP